MAEEKVDYTKAPEPVDVTPLEEEVEVKMRSATLAMPPAMATQPDKSSEAVSLRAPVEEVKEEEVEDETNSLV